MNVYLTCMGEIYKLTRAGYKKYLKAVAEEGSADIGKFGKLMSRIHNVTDITRSDAQLILDGGRVSHLPVLK